jgi:hypothetical protein
MPNSLPAADLERPKDRHGLMPTLIGEREARMVEASCGCVEGALRSKDADAMAREGDRPESDV